MKKSAPPLRATRSELICSVEPNELGSRLLRHLAASIAVKLPHGSLAAELYATFFVDADALHLDDVAHLHHVLGLLHAEVGEFGDVAETVLAGHYFNEAAELLDRDDAAFVDLVDLDLLEHLGDDLLGPGHPSRIVRVDVHGAVVLHIDLASGLRDDAFNVFALRPDQHADLLRVDLERLDARRVRRELLARSGEARLHCVENFHAVATCAEDRLVHQTQRNAGELQVELESGETLAGAAEFPVHVTEVILAANDVGEHLVTLQVIAVELGDQTGANAGNGLPQRHTCVHQRQTAR